MLDNRIASEPMRLAEAKRQGIGGLLISRYSNIRVMYTQKACGEDTRVGRRGEIGRMIESIPRPFAKQQ